MESKTTAFVTVAGTLAIGAGAVSCTGGHRHAAIPEKPNIILLLVDDMGYKDTGYTGSDYYETPVIDSLAALSMKFSQGYACAGNSAPSRSCLISGQFTPRNGIFAVYNTHRGPEEKMRLVPYPNTSDLDLSCYTIAEAMRDAGYRTGMIGKWHLGNSEHSPAMQGFDYAEEEHPASKEDFRHTGDPKNMFHEVEGICNFMEKAVGDGKPFFAYLPFHAVHTAWQARKEYIDYFKAKPAGERHNDPLYAAMIRHLDDAVGILLAKVRELGISDNTIIVFTSDNGGVPKTSQAPLRGFKGCLYEGGIRVPYFIHNPSFIPAGECDMPVANVDLFPTFVDFAGGIVPGDKILDGISLKEILTGKKNNVARPVLYWHFPGYLDKPCPGGRDDIFRLRPVTMMRKGDWKLFLYYEEWMLDGGWDKRDTNACVELYNIREDVSETRNLASEMPDRRDSMLREMLEWIEVNDVRLPSLPE